MAKENRRAEARSLRRKIGTRRPKKTLVVFCEGEKTVFPHDNPSSGMHRLIATIQPA